MFNFKKTYLKKKISPYFRNLLSFSYFELESHENDFDCLKKCKNHIQNR